MATSVRLGAAMLALALAAGCERGEELPEGNGHNLLLITLEGGSSEDAIPLDGADWRGHCVPVSDDLRANHASLFLGELPVEHGLRRGGTYRAGSPAATLTQSMRERRARCAAFLSDTELHPAFGGVGAPDHLDLPRQDELSWTLLGPDAAPSRPSRSFEQTVAAAIDWLEHTPSPWFVWIQGRWSGDDFEGRLESVLARLDAHLHATERTARSVVAVVATGPRGPTTRAGPDGSSIEPPRGPFALRRPGLAAGELEVDALPSVAALHGALRRGLGISADDEAPAACWESLTAALDDGGPVESLRREGSTWVHASWTPPPDEPTLDPGRLILDAPEAFRRRLGALESFDPRGPPPRWRPAPSVRRERPLDDWLAAGGLEGGAPFPSLDPEVWLALALDPDQGGAHRVHAVAGYIQALRDREEADAGPLRPIQAPLRELAEARPFDPHIQMLAGCWKFHRSADSSERLPWSQRARALRPWWLSAARQVLTEAGLEQQFALAHSLLASFPRDCPMSPAARAEWEQRARQQLGQY